MFQQWSAFLLVATLWSGSFVAIERAIQIFPPTFSAFLRITVALPILAAFCLWKGQKLSVPRALRLRVWTTGLFALGLPFSLLFFGERYTSPGVAGLLNGTVTLWTYLLGYFFSRGNESFTKIRTFGIGLGLLGIALVYGPRMGGAEITGVVAITGMAVCYAIGLLLNRTLTRPGTQPLDRMSNLVQQHLAAWVYLALLTLALGQFPSVDSILHHPGSKTAWFAIAYMGLGSTALAFMLFYFLIENWGAVRSSTIAYLVPALSFVWDYVFNGRTPSQDSLIGCALILVAIVFIQKKSAPDVIRVNENLLPKSQRLT